MLEDHWGQERAKDIPTVSLYMMLQGNVIYYLPNWAEETVTFGGRHLASAGISRLFSGITENERISFFSDWIKRNPLLQKLSPAARWKFPFRFSIYNL